MSTQTERTVAETADEIVRRAWRAVPEAHRRLLETVGGSSWQIVARPLGGVATELEVSAGRAPMSAAARTACDRAVGVWMRDLRVVLINEAHPALAGADRTTRRVLLTWTAWHEWGHALSVIGLAQHDASDGERLLAMAPIGVRERIRRGGYASSDHLGELFAETYALLLRESMEGRCGRPAWLPEEIYRLLSSLWA